MDKLEQWERKMIEMKWAWWALYRFHNRDMHYIPSRCASCALDTNRLLLAYNEQ